MERLGTAIIRKNPRGEPGSETQDVNGAENTRFGRAASPLAGGVVAQFFWAVPLAIFLWVAAAWAMGWLP